MSEFDARARGWDANPMHRDRSEAIAKRILETAPLKHGMRALEYGAGTGILSFLLADRFSEVILMDSSQEMVRIINEKIHLAGIDHFRAMLFDLEKSDYHGNTFDGIYTQMVMHHVTDPGKIIGKFYELLSPDGWVAIADLYPEDGSFHGEGFTGHNGFDPEELKKTALETGFRKVKISDCYTVNKMVNDQWKDFPLFLLVALK